MAENIQALIDLLAQEILKYDLSHIKGDEIVSGNAEHCINLLQLVHEISLMIADKQEGGAEGADGADGADMGEEEGEGMPGQQLPRLEGDSEDGEEMEEGDDENDIDIDD